MLVVCKRCGVNFLKWRRGTFGGDKKICPDCVAKLVDARLERDGHLTPPLNYDQQLRDGFSMLGQDSGNIEVSK